MEHKEQHSEHNHHKRPVFIVDGSRTPYLKVTTKENPLSAVEMALSAISPLLLRQPFDSSALDEVVVGCVSPSADEMNIGRIIALRMGCSDKVMGYTVQRNCASSLQALDNAYLDIASGRYNLVLAGGTECMSRAPLLFPSETKNWLSALQSEKKWSRKILKLLQFRPRFLKPVIGLLRGLEDPVVNMSMGQTAEKLSFQFNITREEMDEFSLRSHQLAAQGHYPEIEPLFDSEGHVYKEDTGIRKDTSLNKLANLKPVFDKPFGLVTAGNSSQVTDGAAFMILASEKAIKEYQLPVKAEIIETTWAALDPSVMGLGPAYAIASLLQKTGLALSDIDYFEINEAFAGQVLACIKALQDETFCREQLGLATPVGEIPLEKLNIDGGAIALGHPVGSSGARLVLHLANVLETKKGKYGIASLCIGGGQGGAMLIERIG